MPRGDQLSRQWRLLHILASRGGQSIPALMQKTGCSRRTLWCESWRRLRLICLFPPPAPLDDNGLERRRHGERRRAPHGAYLKLFQSRAAGFFVPGDVSPTNQV